MAPGTSIVYNYLDYRFLNATERDFQLIIWTDDTYLRGELRSTKPLPMKYHIHAENERFVEENGVVYRPGHAPVRGRGDREHRIYPVHSG